MADYRDGRFEWDEGKSAERKARSGFDFHVGKRILESNRFVDRFDRGHSDGEERWIATGLLGSVFFSVVYVERGPRKRIISVFEAGSDDIVDFMVSYAKN